MALLSERYKNDGISIYDLNQTQIDHINIFNNKLAKGIYNTVNYICECGSDDFEELAQKDRYGIPVKTVICKNCGLIMTNPRLDDTSNASFYDNEYHYIYRAETKPSYDNFITRRNNASDIINFVKDHTGISSGKMLEIGCADGGNVAAFSLAGYDAYGIDLSHDYTNFGIEQGLNVRCCSSADLAKKGDKYDLIIVNHVLEHFTDLESELSNISKLLNDDGILFVAVPGVRYLSFKAYGADFLQMLQNAHVYNFTKDTLCPVMRKHGFDCIYCNEFIYGLFKKGEKVSDFRNHYPKIRSYLDIIENAKGDTATLLKERLDRILNDYGPKEVLLYGSIVEMDVIISLIEDPSPIKGFLATDNKNMNEVQDFINKNRSSVKCLLLADSEKDSLLMNYFNKAKNRHYDLFSVFTETF